MNRRGALLVLLAGAAVAATLVTVAVRSGPAGSLAGGQPAGAPALPTLPPAGPLQNSPAGGAAVPVPPATPPRRAPATATWAGRLGASGATLAIAARGGVAVAYLCDGKRTEAWLRGTAVGGRLELAAPVGGGRLTGSYRAAGARGTVTAAGRTWSFDIAVVTAPGGLYRSAATVRGAKVVGGWIVLADGRQVGLATVAGRITRPSPVDTARRTATVAGSAVHADRLG